MFQRELLSLGCRELVDLMVSVAPMDRQALLDYKEFE